MQTSGVSAQLGAIDLAALIAFGTTKPGITPAFRYNDSHRGILGGAQAFHRKLLDDHEPCLAFMRQGGNVHLCGETSDIDAAEALRRANSLSLRYVRDMDWGTLEFAIGEGQSHMLCFGQVR